MKFNNGLVPEKSSTKICNYLIIAVCSLVVLAPIITIFNVSFKSNTEYINTKFYELPENLFYFDNYLEVLEKGNFLLAYKNTLFLIVVATFGNIVLGTMVAYIIGRFRFKGKNIIMGAFMAATMIPTVTTQVATFTIIKGMHLYNTIWAAVVLYLGTGIIQIYIFLQFVKNIPYELDESAMIDGASYFRIYIQIILPAMRPAIVTVAIIKVLDIYNDMFTPYLYMPSAKLRTVTTALMQFSYDQNTQWNIMSAAIIFVLIPTLLIYVYLQKYIMAGIADGAVKG